MRREGGSWAEDLGKGFGDVGYWLWINTDMRRKIFKSSDNNSNWLSVAEVLCPAEIPEYSIEYQEHY